MRARLGLIAGVASSALLTACGGSGGGVVSTPAPPVTVTPTPAPAPTPTPTPTSSFDTGEYRATVGAVNMNALAAYAAGATGAGVGIAIIDSGLDLQSEEFEGRVSPASQAFAGSTTIDDEGGHGTAVAFTAAGRRNGTGTQGVAFGATVIALRADRAGSCSAPATEDDEGGCRFGTDAIRQGVDAARVAGAKVINISLGGSTMPQTLQAAIGRATAAGIVVVIAAGNDGTDSPDPFTSVAQTPNANGSIIIAGSVGAGSTLSPFSDKAGTGADTYLTAVGERVRAPGADGLPRFWSGTSFAAPQISGAVALLAQAFPNLTGAQIVSLLLTTARDAGAAGTDPIYGRGVLDLTRAFQPVGASVLAGSRTAVSLTANGRTSAAMGDAGLLGTGAVILDGYGRAFAIDLAQTLSRSAPTRPLLGALGGSTRQVALAASGTSVAMTLAPARSTSGSWATLGAMRLFGRDAEAARALAGSVVQRLGGGTSLAFGFRQGAAGLVAGLTGAHAPAFLVGDGAGFDLAAQSAGAVRQQVGGWGLTAAAESGAVLSANERLLPGAAHWRRSPYQRFSLGLDRRAGPLTANAGMTRLDEAGTLLGSRLGPALGTPGAQSWFAEAGARLDTGGWTLGASWRRGWTAARLHGLAGDGRLSSEAWSADVARGGLGLRIAQPLRVGGGGLDLMLPTGWDYATGAVSAWTPQRLGLAPRGRELDVEARWLLAVGGGQMQTNLYWRREPGNIAAAPSDAGAAVRWSWGI